MERNGIDHVVRLREYQMALRVARERRLARRTHSYGSGVGAGNGHLYEGARAGRHGTGLVANGNRLSNGSALLPVAGDGRNGKRSSATEGWVSPATAMELESGVPRFYMLGVTIPELLVAKHRQKANTVAPAPVKNNVYRGGNGTHPHWMDEHDDAAAAASASSCSCLLVLRLLDMLVLLGLCIGQGSLLNFLIIWHLQRSHVVYLWFLADFVVVMGFVGALTTSYQRVARIFFRRSTKASTSSPLKSPGGNGVLPTYGVLPLGYLSWLLYSGVLVAKIVVIFKFNIANNLGKEELFTSQLLKVVLGGGASLIFLLLVNAHRPPSHPDDDCRAYITGLCTGTAFEIFDAVAFLELLFVMESRLILPFWVETTILVLASANLLLPALPLFRLSLSDYGRRQRPAVIGLIYSTLKLLAIESPYLGIRIYLWSFYGASTSSIFVLKNLLMIVVKLRYVIPEYIQLIAQQHARRKRVDVSSQSAPSTITRTSHLEMSTIQ